MTQSTPPAQVAEAAKKPSVPKKIRVKTPLLIQMEAVECGAAALGIILGYYNRIIPLEELRVQCGVSRDGSKASNVIKAAREHGMIAKGFKSELDNLKRYKLPYIVFWNFNHFLVVEGLDFNKKLAYLNDPASGPRVISIDEFDQAFTGVVLTFEPGPDFKPSGEKPNVFRALRKRLRGSESALLYIVLVSLALVIPNLVIPIFTRIFIDDVLVNGRDWIVPLVIGMVITAALRALLIAIQQFYLLRLETKLALSMSSNFFWHVLRLPIEFFGQRFAGEIGSRVAINDRVAGILSGELATTILNLILIVFYAALMFIYDPILTIIGIAIALLNIAALQYFSRQRIDVNQKLMQERGKLLGTTMSGLQLIETLKATGSESDFFARWAGYQAKGAKAEQELGISTSILNVVPVFLSALNTTAILAIGSLRVMSGDMTIGMLVAFQYLMSSFIDPVNQIVSLGSVLQEVIGDINRLDDVFRHPVDEQVDRIVEQPEDAANQAKLQGYIDIRDLTFGYNKLEAPLIEGFSLSLKPGTRVALVGGSGSGKSTISKVVAGLYEPWSGEILFDGVPRSKIPRQILNNSIAMVDQDIFMYEGTVRDNLTLWDQTVAQSDIIQAARDASIHEAIADRPRGYDYFIEEGGRNFSGGQRQRLEIARALVGNPTILILDEATSALDPITEKLIDDHLRRRGCTCVIVAHRLSTIRDCDEIIVLENGKVVQRGTHDELKHLEGTYAKLIGAEASNTNTKKEDPKALLDRLL